MEMSSPDHTRNQHNCVVVIIFIRGFPSGLLNEGPRDSLCEVNGSLIIIQGLLF